MSLVHKNNKLLPYDIIYAAAKGDIIAIGIVLKNYEAYIVKLCTKTLYDKRGNAYKCLDLEKKNLLELKLIYKILKFKFV
ncbi:helix-turn-helix domain-containing protein [Clostridioides difficile]|uniref:helix-turn-helix domain-containing protein n=1 Tax=Peptostreptococcaceae TaxID=186804 RepID=UPI0003B297EE|nr:MULTISPECIES: helix-turn-helix domain-containing protein [Peptostreptococcaceae]EGT4547880.1 helix-turn-helix domain-containing protein [Clostridioides difficile]EGT4615278.1 helix-turn-helix domain-containing protein [Clostridioides difficile]EGT4733131.1 helix-turn-helix domain-containing protein [Clostridioides difficile]EGT4782050.1 helix-turn-helix domain-containing protein [Clostridioides difficile]EGT5366246.1 helix-turn-helix domain-containing protein [Clostridioides difficile]